MTNNPCTSAGLLAESNLSAKTMESAGIPGPTGSIGSRGDDMMTMGMVGVFWGGKQLWVLQQLLAAWLKQLLKFHDENMLTSSVLVKLTKNVCKSKYVIKRSQHLLTIGT